LVATCLEALGWAWVLRGATRRGLLSSVCESALMF